MKYFVEVGGREHEVTVKSQPDGTLEVDVGGKTMSVEATPHAARELTVKVGDRVIDMTIEGTPPQLGVVGSGHRTYVKVESERMRVASRAAGGGAGGKEKDVRSPMPGRVVKVLVNQGDTVAQGQSVAIVEAMKMENEVRAKKGGVVARVHVAAGATVEGNAVLVSFEP
jgi:biotin carboxyl carrier protein